MNIGRVVIISDIDTPGVVVGANAELTIFSIRTITGALYSRDLDEVTDASEAVTARTIADIKILSARHAALADAFAAVATGLDEIVPGRTVASVPLRTGRPGVTRRDVIADMRRTFAARNSRGPRPMAPAFRHPRSVSEMI